MALNLRELLKSGSEQLYKLAGKNTIVKRYMDSRDGDLSQVPIVYLYQQLAIELAEENERLKAVVPPEHLTDNVRMVIEIPKEYINKIKDRLENE
jgi:hypothetical protein